MAEIDTDLTRQSVVELRAAVSEIPLSAKATTILWEEFLEDYGPADPDDPGDVGAFKRWVEFGHTEVGDE